MPTPSPDARDPDRPTAAAGTRRRYIEIDVLRGLAAFWVVLSHYLPYWNKYLGPAPIIVPNSWGIYAVKLFFVVSGFVIFMTLERCATVTDFAVLRFSRLYPTYWATLGLVTVVSALAFGVGIWPGGLVVNATMFQEFLGFPNFDNVYWSLTVELAFYLNVAWLFALGLHRRSHAVVVGWLLLTCLWSLTPHLPGTDHRGLLAKLFAFDFAPYFALGITFFSASRQGWSRSHAGLVALALATEFLLTGWIGLGIAAGIALIFSLALWGRLPFLVSRVTVWLGAISYSLYLLHRNLGYLTLDWLHAHKWGPGAAVPVVILAALGLASAVTYGVERPAMRWIRRLHDGWKARRARPAV
jgi:peptidoglycan/LPS O-acetylase OafA/YrhL